MPGLTRRELLAGAGTAAALALVGCGGDERPRARTGSATAPSTTPPAMRKGASLIGDVNVYDDSLGVRGYLQGGPHPTTFIALWAIWPRLQPAAPSPFTREQALHDLGDPGGPAASQLAALDAQIAQAKADGCEVALTLYQAFPAWAQPAAAALAAVVNEAHVPHDLSPDGPWAWFVAFLCARYARGGAGNPAGAEIDWLQPMNEPNLTWEPQRAPFLPAGTIAGATAELSRTAAAVAAATPGGPGLLLPGASDVVGRAGTESGRGTPWDAFSAELLAHLQGWEPGVPVGWAHHNYADVKHGPEDDGRWRVERLLELQADHGWPEPSVWLTEGGYQFGVRRNGWIAPDVERWVVDPARTADPAHPDVYAEQVARIRENWAAMARLPVRVWTQYQVHDRDVRFQSGLRGPVRDTPAGRVAHDPPYPAYELWPQLAA
ncbi:MAG TPA: hypothetical protein VK506_00010 [Conexibacter sp.]|nr:hypothetical protein [Conexibacter sp.]